MNQKLSRLEAVELIRREANISGHAITSFIASHPQPEEGYPLWIVRDFILDWNLRYPYNGTSKSLFHTMQFTR